MTSSRPTRTQSSPARLERTLVTPVVDTATAAEPTGAQVTGESAVAPGSTICEHHLVQVEHVGEVASREASVLAHTVHDVAVLLPVGAATEPQGVIVGLGRARVAHRDEHRGRGARLERDRGRTPEQVAQEARLVEFDPR